MPAKKYNSKKYNQKKSKEKTTYEAPIMTKNEENPNYVFIKKILGEPKTLNDFSKEPFDSKVFYVAFYDYYKNTNEKTSKPLDLYKIDFNEFKDFTSFDELISALNQKYINFVIDSFEVQDKQNNRSKILTQSWAKPTPQLVLSNYILNSPENKLSFFGEISNNQDHKIDSQITKAFSNKAVKYNPNNLWTDEEWKKWRFNLKTTFFNNMDLKTQKENFITKPLFEILLESYDGPIHSKDDFKKLIKTLVQSLTAKDFFDTFTQLSKTSKEPFFQDAKVKQILERLQTLSQKDWKTLFEEEPHLGIDFITLKTDIPSFALLATVIKKYFDLMKQGFEIEGPSSPSLTPPPTPEQPDFDPVDFLALLEVGDLTNLTVDNIFDNEQPELTEKLISKLKMKLLSKSKTKTLSKS